MSQSRSACRVAGSSDPLIAGSKAASRGSRSTPRQRRPWHLRSAPSAPTCTAALPGCPIWLSPSSGGLPQNAGWRTAQRSRVSATLGDGRVRGGIVASRYSGDSRTFALSPGSTSRPASAGLLLAGSIRDPVEPDTFGRRSRRRSETVELTVPLSEIECRPAGDPTEERREDLADSANWLGDGGVPAFLNTAFANDTPVRDVSTKVLHWLGWLSA